MKKNISEKGMYSLVVVGVVRFSYVIQIQMIYFRIFNYETIDINL